MSRKTWVLAKPKPSPWPKVPLELRAAVDAGVEVVIATLRKRLPKKPDNPLFNWSDDIIARWHRNSLYFVVVMRTPHGRPPTFEAHHARLEYAGNGTFNLGVPMRRGWNTVLREATPEDCLKEFAELPLF